MRYKIYDSLGNYMKSFPDYKKAFSYKYVFGNYGWTIKK